MIKKIVISDGLSEPGLEVLKNESGFQVDVHNKMTPEELKTAVQDASALIVRSASKVTVEIMETADNLKIIGRAGTGVDNIDLAAATRRGILVSNAPEANTISVADHTVAMLLALCRHLPFAHSDLKQGRWEKKKYEGIELEDKAVGVLGLGRIGREVVKRLRGFDTRILAYDPFVSERVAKEMEVELLSLDDVLATADFITLHMPLLADTTNFLNRRLFEKMKKGMQVINCARGELIDEAALLEALENGTVAGAALDVFSEEPPKSDLLMKIIRHPRVIVTPHLAASTLEAQEKVGQQIAMQIRDYLRDGTVRNPVNFYSMTREEFARNEPYLILGERLGSFLAQISGGGYRKVGIEFRGAVAHLSKEAILHSVLKGLLGHISQKVNIVNALSLARERGIEIISTVKEQDATFSSLIALMLETDHSHHKVTGTVFEKELIRLIAYDDVYLDFRPQGTLLFFKNHDTPGVVGKIGTALGSSGINIGSMKLGRVPEAGFAYGVVNVDGDLPESVVVNLRRLPEIVDARALRIG